MRLADSAVWAPVRALRSRAGSSALTFAVSALAVAAAAAGPTFYRAAQTSVLRDAVAGQSFVGRGVEVTASGPITAGFGALEGDVSTTLGPVDDLFGPPVEARQATAFFAPTSTIFLLVSSTDVCAHLQVTGTCPQRAGQILLSRQVASANGWRIGQGIPLKPWGNLTVTGLYTPPTAQAGYWADQYATYFPYEYGLDSAHATSQSDALFTDEATLLGAPQETQGTNVFSRTLLTDRLTPGAAGPLASRTNELTRYLAVEAPGTIVTSTVATTVHQAKAEWTALAVSVLVVTLQLLAVAVLLLWILVTDAIAARGSEIALAKLRGYGRLRVGLFALGEPAVILAAALPVGVLAGWGASAWIAAGLLRPGTAVTLPLLAWGAGGAAALGGFTAVVAGARPTLRLSVLELWRRSGRRPARPSWVFDAVVVTGALAGLAEVVVSGSISSAHRHPVALLVPGLVGLAAAVLASRLLPVAAAALASRARRGGPGLFLALRQLARRPAAMRTTTVVGTAFALAAFAGATWSLGRQNYDSTARAKVGAPTVLHVTVPLETDLGTLVARADPGGRHATAVEEYFSNATTTLAVDPSSWGRIARRGLDGPTDAQLAALDPSEPAPLVLNGTALRIRVGTAGVGQSGTSLAADVACPYSAAPTPVQFAAVPRDGQAELTALLPPCAGVLSDLRVVPPPAAAGSTAAPAAGSVTVAGLDVRAPSGVWSQLPVADVAASSWYPGPVATLVPAAQGFSWALAGTSVVQYRDRPFPLPAVAARSVTPRTGPFTATGLDGTDLPVDVVATPASTPGAPGAGVIVDRQYAHLAAQGYVAPTDSQVWIAGDPGPVESALRREGVAISSVSTIAATAATYGRSGPGLADSLFLAEAGAAAVLASGTVVAALYLLARRRRYELAALVSVGVSRRRLATSVLIEQLSLVAYGAAVGVGAGLASAAVLLVDIPEFDTTPAGVVLARFPSAYPLAAILAGAFLLVAAAAAVAAVRLVSGTELTQLREVPG